MRKPMFYARLALGNLWRNRSTTLPYLLACVVSVFTFYTMLAINLNGALNGIRQQAIVQSFTLIGTIILALFCSALIFYTNSFLIKRRKKELGLYSVLGMEKRNIGALMFFETLFIAAIALVLGLLLGTLLSKLLFWVMLRMVRYPVMLEMPISGQALLITAALFGVVFLLALLSNLRQVRRSNAVDLMAGAKQGEREPKASWLLTLAGLACLGGGYFLALYFQSPVEVLFMFLLAVLLVIAGTFCLFTSGSIALLKLMRRNKRYYYNPQHFISVSGMIYRMKQNAAGLAAICILSCMVLVTVSSTVSLNLGAEDSLKNQYPYAYSLTFSAPADGDVMLAGAEQIARKTGVELTNMQDHLQSSFMAREENGSFTHSENFDSLGAQNMFLLLTLEDYNRRENQNVTLAPGQALLLVTGGRYQAESLTLNGIPLQLQHLEKLGKATADSRDVARTFSLILPDESAVQAILAAAGLEYAPQRQLKFDISGSEAGMAQFEQDYSAFVRGVTSTQAGFNYRSRSDASADWYVSNGGFLFLGTYFGILFMLAAALIIYYKQMSEGYDDAERFEILQKVGMGEEEVKKTINRQILAVFFLPLAGAVLHITIAFFPISRVMVVFGVMNTGLLALASLLTVLAYALVYLLVFRQTAGTYFRIVRRSRS